MEEKRSAKVLAIAIISDYLGVTTGKLYAKFYDKQDDKTVILSVKELLIEYLGTDRANEILMNKGLEGTV
jgi:hypothetical protein